ncbi:MAG: O-methyltransferase [Planctomycetota bacterium]|jgi:caffeoyl-CoA O-methyltransferase
MALRVGSLVLGIAASATEVGGAEAPGKRDEPDVSQVQPVIDEVERICLEKTVFMIGRRKAERLAELVREKRPETVVECGTAIGYSGLWIARELKRADKGRLITMEISPRRARQAETFFRKAGLEKFVTVRIGDATKLTRKLEGPIDLAFIDCGYSNYHPILVNLKGKFGKDALVVADNVGIGSGSMKDYLDAVRRYDSRTEWFDLDLPWAKRDAMEVSVMRRERGPFLDWPEDRPRTVGDGSPRSAVADVVNLTAVQPSTYEKYQQQRRMGRVTVESIRDGYVYYAIEDRRDVPFAPSEGGAVSAWVSVTERYKARIPAVK